MSFWQKVRKSWEWRSAVFLFRGLMTLCFIFFVILGAQAFYHWAHIKWVRARPLSEITKVAEESIQLDKPKMLLTWAIELSAKDHQDIIRLLEPYSGKISSLMFIKYSDWMQQAGKPDEAVFWRQYARYRIRFDVLRCGIADVADSEKEYISYFDNAGLQKDIDKNPASIARDIQLVLDFDAKYPAVNNPVDVCAMIQSLAHMRAMPVPEGEWPRIRFTMRMVTEQSLKKMNGTPREPQQ